MSLPAALPQLLAEALVALLLVASGVLSLLAAIGLLRFRTFYQRLHAAALVPTLSVWLTTIASIVYFWQQPGGLVLHQIAVPVLLAITVPVSTVLLMRVALFRGGSGSGSGSGSAAKPDAGANGARTAQRASGERTKSDDRLDGAQ